jgi:MFS transporter, Spinster family, sphingosine-1-phosphate transporter
MQSRVYKHYLLGVLTVILLFNYVDRLALGVMLEDIKSEFSLSDTQLGILSGIAFALFYSIMGIPIARWADRGNRVTIIWLTALLWSVAVALCGVAASFVQLLLIRIVVAVGEAGCTPPAYSLMADYFSRAERPRAAAIYGLAGTLSAVVGYMVAGWLNELFGWRVTFILLGIPGLLLAALARFTLREPRLQTQNRDVPGTVSASQPSLGEVWATLTGSVTFRHLLLCVSVMSFFLYGIGQWHAPFFIRTYGLETGQIGTWLTVVWGLGGLVGAYMGGELASRHAAQNESLQLFAMSIAIAISGLLTMFVYLAPNAVTAFTLMGLAAIGLNTSNGPLYATIQTLVPARMRAMSIALVFFFANLIGAGLGPLATGVISDALRPWAGDQSLRYALLCLAPGYFWVAWHAWRASQTVAHDLRSAPTESEQMRAPREGQAGARA